MAFSPDEMPADLPGDRDEVLWGIASGASGVVDSMEHLLHGVKLLRAERDDAVEAAHFNSVRASDLELRLDQAEETRLRLVAELETERRKNAAAAEVFGGALTSVDHFTNVKGPNRPNRPKLSDWEANIVRDYAKRTGAKVSDIARRWGVHSSTISRILNGKAY